MQGFSDLGVDEWLVRQLGALAITTPTEIQQLAIPHLLLNKSNGAAAGGGGDAVPQRKNLIGIAETGGGKTAAFALPILQHLAQELYGVFAVVVTASRELGYQLADQFVALGAPLGVRVAIVIGGTPHEKQLEQLEKARPHIVVATPGRLAMLMRSFGDNVRPALRNVRYVVLDEADRLLEDEMAADTLDCVRFIAGARRNKKTQPPPQMLMFTATASPRLSFPQSDVWAAAGFVPESADEAAADATTTTTGASSSAAAATAEQIKKYAPVIVGQSNALLLAERYAGDGDNEDDDDAKSAGAASDGPKIPSTIHQTVISVPHAVKLPFLIVALRRHVDKERSAIVFTNSCVRCELVRMTLQLLGFPVCSLNSLLNQKQRLENLALFKTGIAKILVATDVAARGLDIPQANVVVHYDFPKLTATYVHRTGRTGRAGAEGESMALVTESEHYFLQRLEARIGGKVHNLGYRSAASSTTASGSKATKKQKQKQQQQAEPPQPRRPTGSFRHMTVTEHEELLAVLDQVSMAKVTGKTHLLDEFGDRIKQHKELSSSDEYKANRSRKIRHDGAQRNSSNNMNDGDDDGDGGEQPQQQPPASNRRAPGQNALRRLELAQRKKQQQQGGSAVAAAAAAAPAAAAPHHVAKRRSRE